MQAQNNNMINELVQINQHLKNVGIQVQLSANDLTSILETEPESSLRSALNDAANNQSAIDYLNDLFLHTLPASSLNQRSETRVDRGQGNVTKLPVQSIDADEKREYLSHHVYGGRGALCFSVDKTKHQFETIAVDAASSTAPKVYDWSKKIRLQLTPSELPILLAVLLGFIPEAEFANHNGKGMKIQHQGKSIFFQLYGKDMGSRSVPVGVSDCFYVTSLCIRQLKRSQTWIDGTDLTLLLQNVVANMKSKGG